MDLSDILFLLYFFLFKNSLLFLNITYLTSGSWVNYNLVSTYLMVSTYYHSLGLNSHFVYLYLSFLYIAPYRLLSINLLSHFPSKVMLFNFLSYFLPFSYIFIYDHFIHSYADNFKIHSFTTFKSSAFF